MAKFAGCVCVCACVCFRVCVGVFLIARVVLKAAQVRRATCWAGSFKIWFGLFPGLALRSFLVCVGHVLPKYDSCVLCLFGCYVVFCVDTLFV